MLKVEFATGVRAMNAQYETQYGIVERPTHRNTTYDMAKFEVCVHRWFNLEQPGMGVAIFNDCKYGASTSWGTMRLSLLRSSASPDPEADRGKQVFKYAVMPHRGNLREAGVIPAAAAFNSPLMVVPTTANPAVEECTSFFQMEQNSKVILDTVKQAESGNAIVIRLYESWGSKTIAEVKVSPLLGVTAVSSCNLLEECDASDDETGGSAGVTWDSTSNILKCPIKPFQVRTLVLATRKKW
eukprot:TRINITY_DN54552_c0_g3_i1.p1 TRINITY_DN54552_c0_g3~~TRINITY_DN54552_c0_g3_i1.p1  ORF type:complete len:241 (+),score=45.97 TRINITY_DN54552_c0_g3_i1:215-937(+)